MDELTWQLAQRPNTMPRANETHPSLLAGVLRCASCRGALSRELRNSHSRQRPMYLCRKHKASGTCAAPTGISSDRVEPYVQLLFFRALACSGTRIFHTTAPQSAPQRIGETRLTANAGC